VSADAKKAQGLVADAVNAAQALPDIRAEAVARGRAKLEAGELGVDAGRLADAIIDDLTK
jgi:anti-sigma28 factor (negative regulator of flagellin synthesis)